MELKILKEEKSALPRKEIDAVITFEKHTPSRKEIKDAVLKKVKAKEDMVIIKKIQTYFGDNNAKITAFVYDNEEAMNSIEHKTMVDKNKKVVEKKEEAPAEEKKEAPKVEEKKEEPKKEETTPDEKKEAPKEEKKAEEPKKEEKAPEKKGEE